MGTGRVRYKQMGIQGPVEGGRRWEEDEKIKLVVN